MSRSEPTVRVYQDLCNDRSFTHSWLPEHTFPVGDATLGQRDALQSLAGVEVHFELAVADERGFVKDFVLGDPRSCYLYVAEATSAPKNRIRSYKGLFAMNGAIRRGDYVEHEVSIQAYYTHLVGLVRVTQDNFHECQNWFVDGARSFFVSTDDKRVFSEDFAETVLLEYGAALPGHAHVNYLKLVVDRCSRGDRVYRMGGYSRNGDADFQMFVHRKELHEILDRVSMQLHRAAIE